MSDVTRVNPNTISTSNPAPQKKLPDISLAVFKGLGNQSWLMNIGEPKTINNILEKNPNLNPYIRQYFTDSLTHNTAVDNAKKISQERNFAENPVVPGTQKNGNGIELTGIHQDRFQNTNNGCWSVYYSLLLQSRGIDLTQENIRGYRPIKHRKEAKELEKKVSRTMNSDNLNSVMEMGDLAMELLPNTALHNYMITPYNKSQADANGITEEQYLANAVSVMKEKIRRAIEVDKSPVGFVSSGHYLTVIGIDGDTVKVKDSMESLDHHGNPDATLEYDLSYLMRRELLDLNGAPVHITWASEMKLSKTDNTILDMPVTGVTVDEKTGEIKPKDSQAQTDAMAELDQRNNLGLQVKSVGGMPATEAQIHEMNRVSEYGVIDEERVYLPKKVNYDALKKRADARTAEEDNRLKAEADRVARAAEKKQQNYEADVEKIRREELKYAPKASEIEIHDLSKRPAGMNIDQLQNVRLVSNWNKPGDEELFRAFYNLSGPDTENIFNRLISTDILNPRDRILFMSDILNRVNNRGYEDPLLKKSVEYVAQTLRKEAFRYYGSASNEYKYLSDKFFKGLPPMSEKVINEEQKIKEEEDRKRKEAEAEKKRKEAEAAKKAGTAKADALIGLIDDCMNEAGWGREFTGPAGKNRFLQRTEEMGWVEPEDKAFLTALYDTVHNAPDSDIKSMLGTLMYNIATNPITDAEDKNVGLSNISTMLQIAGGKLEPTNKITGIGSIPENELNSLNTLLTNSSAKEINQAKKANAAENARNRRINAEHQVNLYKETLYVRTAIKARLELSRDLLMRDEYRKDHSTVTNPNGQRVYRKDYTQDGSREYREMVSSLNRCIDLMGQGGENVLSDDIIRELNVLSVKAKAYETKNDSVFGKHSGHGENRLKLSQGLSLNIPEMTKMYKNVTNLQGPNEKSFSQLKTTAETGAANFGIRIEEVKARGAIELYEQAAAQNRIIDRAKTFDAAFTTEFLAGKSVNTYINERHITDVEKKAQLVVLGEKLALLHDPLAKSEALTKVARGMDSLSMKNEITALKNDPAFKKIANTRNVNLTERWNEVKHQADELKNEYFERYQDYTQGALFKDVVNTYTNGTRQNMNQVNRAAAKVMADAILADEKEGKQLRELMALEGNDNRYKALVNNTAEYFRKNRTFVLGRNEAVSVKVASNLMDENLMKRVNADYAKRVPLNRPAPAQPAAPAM